MPAALPLEMASVPTEEPATSAPLGDPTIPAPIIPLTFSFATEGDVLRPLTTAERPYYSEIVVPLVDSGTHDTAGVRMFRISGQLFDHPVAQAQYALLLLNAHRITGNVAYLDRARANAERLITRAEVWDAAWFFPYPFDITHASDVHRAPWYSGMAQGQALSVFVRLYQITGDARYRAAADWTFNSFLQPRTNPAQVAPWTVVVDDADLYWIEEYPAEPIDYTFNGHVWAIYGLTDYWAMSGRAEASELALGAIAAARHVAYAIRRPGTFSRYCLKHSVVSPAYHLHHWFQLMQLYTLTGTTEFARLADTFAADYPDPRLSGTARFLAGRHTAYRFDASGRVIGTRTVAFASQSQAPVSTRRKVTGQSGIWLLVSAGAFAGHWVRESPTAVFLMGIHASQRHPAISGGPAEYLPARRLTVAAGSYRAYRYHPATGAVLGSKLASFSRPSSTFARQVAIINGRPHARIIAGTWTGYWLPLDTRVTFD